MGRFRLPKHPARWLAAGVLVCAALGVALVALVPGWVKSSLEQRLARRTGLDVHIESMSLWPTSAVVENITARDERGTVEVVLERLVVGGNLLLAPFVGSEAIDAVEASSLRARVDVSRAEPSQAAAVANGAAGAAAAEAQPERPKPDAGESPGLPFFELRDATLELHDGVGELAKVSLSELTHEKGRWVAALEQLRLGSSELGGLVASQVDLELSGARRPRLRAAEVDGVEVYLTTTSMLPGAAARSGETEPTAAADLAEPAHTRSADAAGDRRAAGTQGDDVGAQEPATSAGPEPQDVGDVAGDALPEDDPQRSTLLARLRRARGILLSSHAPGRASPEAAGSGAKGEPALQGSQSAGADVADAGASPARATEASSPARPVDLPWLGELTSDAQISWRGVRVQTVRSEGGERVLRELSGRIVRDDGALHLTGEAVTSQEGKGSWDVRLWPSEARAEGRVELEALPLALLVPVLPEVPWHDPEKARLDLSLVIRAETVERLALEGHLRLRDAALSHPRIAPVAVDDISLDVSGKGRWLPASRRLEVDEAVVRVDEARAQVAGALEWAPDHYLFALDVEVPPTRCNALLHSVPEDLLGEIASFNWEGTMSGRLHVKVDSRALQDTELDMSIRDRCDFVFVPMLADVRQFDLPFMHSVLEPDGTIFEMETGPGTPNWTPLTQISPYFVQAVLAHEDRGFFSHHGFSPPHIRNALARNLEAGRYVIGASTITMQLAKNLFLHREKTLQRKVQEAFLTWWAERGLDKAQILELYLNVIEYGPSIYGIRHAARHYFNRTPAELSPAEGVFLACILPNPKKYYSYFEQRALTSGMKTKMRRMLERMKDRGWYSPEAADYGLTELESFQFHPDDGSVPAPREIPGYAEALPYQTEAAEGAAWDAIVFPDDGQPDLLPFDMLAP